MVDVKEILHVMEQMAPPSLAEEWDNVGLLVDCGKPVQNVLVTLDVTKEVVEEAKEKNCGLIVSHHPVIFKPLKNISSYDIVYELVKNDISVICMHTNLDTAENGVSDTLAKELGLQSIKPFAGGGRIGELPQETTTESLAKWCREEWNTHVAYCDAGGHIKFLAVVGGAGGDFFEKAVLAGADCLLTGEVGHHDALDAKALGLSTIAATHFATEFFVVPVVAKKLRTAFPNVNVYVTKKNKELFCYL